MFLSNVPYDVVKDLESLADFLDPIAKINEKLITLSLVNGVYDGRVAVPVEEYRLAPPKNFDIPLVSPTGEASKASVTIRIFATGVPLGLDKMDEPAIVKICYYCRSKGHEKNECPQLSKKSGKNHNGSRCKICGADEGCTRKNCKNFDSIKQGIIERHSFAPKPPKSIFSYKAGDSSSSFFRK